MPADTVFPATTGTTSIANPCVPMTLLGCLADVRGLRPLLSFGDFELHRVAFLQAFVSLGCNRAVMNKNVRAIRAPDKAIAFRVIEPLDGSFQAFHAAP